MSAYSDDIPDAFVASETPFGSRKLSVYCVYSVVYAVKEMMMRTVMMMITGKFKTVQKLSK